MMGFCSVPAGEERCWHGEGSRAGVKLLRSGVKLGEWHSGYPGYCNDRQSIFYSIIYLSRL